MAQKRTELKAWLTPAQAARELGLTPHRIQQMIDAGQLEGQRSPLGRLASAKSVDAEVARRQALAQR